MFKKPLILFSLFLLLMPAAFAQARGGRQGRGSGRSQGHGQGQQGMPTGSAQMERSRIHATTQQRDQIRACDRLADGIRKQARKMAQTSKNKFNADEAIQQQNQIRNQIQTMNREHERLISGLDTAQQQAWQEQIRNMTQLRQQINLRQQQMEAELKTSPGARSVSERAQEMERMMNSLRNQYAVLLSQMEP